ncbi:MAG TPA: nuclear transport factor 2 family protein [Candidatus Binataceae bacterium]|nr:nuclear transport factor 2 family protein [Candidatus Binataceae bacterium]
MAKTLEQTITELADRDQIRELPQRYCDCVWRGDVDGIVALFADDGVFTIAGNNRETTNKGHADLKKTYAAGFKNLTPRPYIHNHVIELKGDGKASGRCYVELRDASDNLKWLGTGFYHDEYVKVGDQWKFQSRSAQMVHMEPKMVAGTGGMGEKK